MQIVDSPDNDDQTGGRLAVSTTACGLTYNDYCPAPALTLRAKNVGSGILSRTGSRLIVNAFYLKSLSLEVIFSSRLEMWYEALAMLVLLAVSLLLADCVQLV